jgi:cytochrome c peroxidase
MPEIQEMKHAFKTPGLRNIDQRAPYMHNGSVPTIRAVIEHYNDGFRRRPSLSADMKPLGLTGGEIDDIVEFLATLTGAEPPVAVPLLP